MMGTILEREPFLDKPFVSVIIPVRNEIKYISQCLNALLNQDYPSNHMEVLLVDGMSDDGTRDVLVKYGSKFDNSRVLDNPARFVPSAMNIGISNAKGDIIVRVDSRCIVSQDYISQCVNYLRKTGADNVGGLQRPIGDCYVKKLIQLATTSRFGIGNSKFRYSQKEQFVETVYLGAYRREVFHKIGLYNESLIRNQDYELNHRLIMAGGKIYFTPKIRSSYHGRPSLRKLWWQYFQYGFWKVRVIWKHPKSIKIRQIVPPLFVLILSSTIVLSLSTTNWLFLSGLAFIYGGPALIASFYASRRLGWRYMLLLPVVFAILHLSWGLGFWWSLLILPFHFKRAPGTS